MTTVDEIVRLLRIGMCAPQQHAANGCSTCDACNAAIAEVQRLGELDAACAAIDADARSGTRFGFFVDSTKSLREHLLDAVRE